MRQIRANPFSNMLAATSFILSLVNGTGSFFKPLLGIHFNGNCRDLFARRVFLPSFVRKLATPPKRNPSLRGSRSFFHEGWQKDPALRCERTERKSNSPARKVTAILVITGSRQKLSDSKCEGRLVANHLTGAEFMGCYIHSPQ